ncbi:DUF4350 domain-containing protein [Algoriphagus sp. AGSA1]|uniref:DUF4350 domain-containing protein n=1 Tax=Algoriphagus sp. AGSA1 TaxID=2907213 RepID=UPI001F1FD593|nr:DUF4350 domain-containing protein [Algoriphagus sp. AGSA1]MCE7054324.1 DUF4350 domain-containing protein [Algoriphagus sp. AGSA1]
MSKGQKILLTLLSLLILGVLLLIHSSPPAVDWSPSYEQNDSRPLGSRVFYDLVKKQSGDWNAIHIPPFEAIGEVPEKATYVIINKYFSTDPDECELLLDWVRSGGHLFVSASSISSVLLDSLGISEDIFPENLEAERLFTLSLEDPMSLSQSITYDQFHFGEYFKWEDSMQVQTLGKIRDKSSLDTVGARPNFIQLRKGRGLVTLHAFPEAFSNYFLLDKTNKSYTEQILGTWDLNYPVLLDHYVKEGKIHQSSPLYLVLGNPYLKAAYYTCWVLLLLWVIFEGKRQQKAIRVITPPQNQSLEFAKTISSIYLNSKDMTELGRLQLKLFWDYCRRTLHLQTGEDKEEFALSLANKSGVHLDETLLLVRQLDLLEAKTQLNADDIQQLYQLIEDFKSKQQHGRNLQPAG